MAEKDTLSDDKAAFKLAVDHEADQRKESLDDLEFAKLGKQWPDDIKHKRQSEGRPCLTINRLPAFIKQVVNDARMNTPTIKVHPVGDGADAETAEILDGLIRNIQTVSQADIAYDTALDFAVTMGFGYIVVRTDYAGDDSFDQDICIERVANPFSIYGDPASKDATSKDWNSAFIVDKYRKAEFEKRWPGASLAGFDSADEDKELWFDDEYIQVAERWTREEVQAQLLRMSDGSAMFEAEYLKIKPFLDAQMITVIGNRPSKVHKVTQRIITGSEILETNAWSGKYIPIVPVYGEEANIEGKRHFLSLVRFAKDPQRMFNYWRTTTTELVALAPKAPFIGATGAFHTDAAKWQSANTQSHPYIEYDPVPGEPPPQRQVFAGVPAGALQEALNASDDMKAIIGIYDASLGARSNETSGKAIIARQREGDMSTFNFIDNLNRAVEHTGRIIVDLIPKVYTVPRILRLMREDGETYSLPVNQPVMPKQGPQAQPGQAGAPMGGPQGMPEQKQEYEPAESEIEGLTRVFDLTAGKYDVTVSAGPSFTTRREESATQMMEFIRVFPQAAPLIGDLLAKNLDWPGADDVAARLKAMLPPQAQGQVNQVVQQLQQQLQQQDGQARDAIGQLQQQLQQAQMQVKDKTLEAQIKAKELELKQRELDIKEYDTVSKVRQSEADQQARMMAGAQDVIGQGMANQPNKPSPTVVIDTPALAAVAESMGQSVAQITAAVQALHAKVAADSGPKRKSARAVRQPDGSFALESVESPLGE